MGLSALFLLTQKAHGSIFSFIAEVFATSPPTTISLPTNNNDHIRIINEQYIFPLNPIEIPTSGVIDVEKLLEPTSNRIYLPGDDDRRFAGQCVIFVKYSLKDIAPDKSGDAIDWKEDINSYEPIVGSVIVFRVGKWGHIGIVIKVTDDIIVVRSRNWHGLWIISDDEFKINDERILGYIDFLILENERLF